MKKLILENLIKNILSLIILFFCYTPTKNVLLTAADKNIAGNLLIGVSIIAVIACFGCFAFTYEKIKAGKLYSRLIAHLTTGLLLLIIGLSLEMTAVLINILIGNFLMMDITLGLLYLAVVLYDFWDLDRVTIQN